MSPNVCGFLFLERDNPLNLCLCNRLWLQKTNKSWFWCSGFFCLFVFALTPVLFPVFGASCLILWSRMALSFRFVFVPCCLRGKFIAGIHCHPYAWNWQITSNTEYMAGTLTTSQQYVNLCLKMCGWLFFFFSLLVALLTFLFCPWL